MLKRDSKGRFLPKSKGLGDDIQKVFKATGIEKVAKAILGDDCGCDERIATLNRMFPRDQQIKRCFTDEEAIQYQEFIDTRVENKWTAQQVMLLFALYKGIYGKSYKMKNICTSCSGTAKLLLKMQVELDNAFKK